jgi:succinate dehydrogenase / fumarate reductase flavoprotein subunit
MSGKREIRIGPNQGGVAPKELVELLEAPSRLDPALVDLNKIDYETDVLVIGGGGAGVTSALFAQEQGAQVLLATKLRLGD